MTDIPEPEGTPLPPEANIKVTWTAFVNIDPRKATGYDNNPFPAGVRSRPGPHFNRPSQEWTVPEDWHHANVTAIYKNVSSQDPDNYPYQSFGKLLEHVIVSHTIKHMELMETHNIQTASMGL